MLGVKLVISDAHEGFKAAVTKVLWATWQCCRVHFGRTTSAYAGKIQRRIVSAWIGTAYAQEDAAAAHAEWRWVTDQRRPKVPKLPALMDAAEEDILAYMHFPAAHPAKLHSQTRSSGSMATSSAAPTSLAYSQTKPPPPG